MQGNILRLERDIFQPTECGVLRDFEQLRRPLAVPGLQDRKRLCGRDEDGAVIRLAARLDMLCRIFRDVLVPDADLLDAEHETVSLRPSSRQARLFR